MNSRWGLTVTPRALERGEVSASDRPLALVVGPDGHGVVQYALDLARAGGLDPLRGTLDGIEPGAPVHLHLTDKLVGASPESAAEAVERFCADRPVTLTLHDVPQPSDGRPWARRQGCYRRFAAAAVAVATNSEHEARSLRDDLGVASRVVPLGTRTAHPEPLALASIPLTALIAGWIYPGKGHEEAITAVGALSRLRGVPGRVVAIGGVSRGHDADADRLHAQARAEGVELVITGHVDSVEYLAQLRAPGIPLAIHAHLSASRSILDWMEQGRRPILLPSPYADETARLRPGTLSVASDVVAAMAAALEDPAATLLDVGASLRPTLVDAAALYREWWSEVL